MNPSAKDRVITALRARLEKAVAMAKAIVSWIDGVPTVSAEDPRDTLLTQIAAIATEAPELNMSNYSEEQVSELNQAMIRISIILQKHKRPD